MEGFYQQVQGGGGGKRERESVFFALRCLVRAYKRRWLIFAQEFAVDCFLEMHLCRKGFEASTGH